MRRIERRRSRASHRASAQRAMGRSQSQLPRNFRICVRSWAVSSWSASMISTLPASGPSFSATSPTTATRSPSWITSGWRSSTTAPSSVLNRPTSSSRTLISCVCALVTVFTQSACTRGRSSIRVAARSENSRRPAAAGPASPFWSGGSRSSSAAVTSMFVYSASTSDAATWSRTSLSSMRSPAVSVTVSVSRPWKRM